MMAMALATRVAPPTISIPRFRASSRRAPWTNSGSAATIITRMGPRATSPLARWPGSELSITDAAKGGVAAR
jgi:hypothetical protein